MGVTCSVAPTFLFGGFRPAGRVPLPAAAKEPNRRWGTAPRSAFAQRALQVAFSPDPCLRERATLAFWLSPAGKMLTDFLSPLGPLGPIAIKICKLLPSIVHRLVRPYLFSAAVIVYTAQLPQLCQTRRCHFNPMSPKFLPCRPQWAEARRTQGLVLGRRKVTEISLEGVPRKMGVWGQAAYERPLRVGAHRRRPPTHLWLLSVRAESNTRLSY